MPLTSEVTMRIIDQTDPSYKNKNIPPPLPGIEDAACMRNQYNGRKRVYIDRISVPENKFILERRIKRHKAYLTAW